MFAFRKRFDPHNVSHTEWNEIYRAGGWGKAWSGPGSLLQNNTFLIAWLHDFCRHNWIQSILDIGCGDCQWIFHVTDALDIQYTGIDASDFIIEQNKIKFDKNFQVWDILDAQCSIDTVHDLVFCKDVLHHNVDALESMYTNILKIQCKYIIIVTPIKTVWRVQDIFKDFTFIQHYQSDELKSILLYKK